MNLVIVFFFNWDYKLFLKRVWGVMFRRHCSQPRNTGDVLNLFLIYLYVITVSDNRTFDSFNNKTVRKISTNYRKITLSEYVRIFVVEQCR